MRTLRRPERDRARDDHRLPVLATSAVAHVSGLALVVGGVGMGVSAIVELATSGVAVRTLVACSLMTGSVGLALTLLTRPPPRVPAASIYAAVLASWVVLVLASSLPYVFSGTFVRFEDAIFESVSGFTTTNASLIASVDTVSKGILFWRASTQWIGGVGFVVFAISVLPFVGGAGIDPVEPSGMRVERLGPRVRETARRLALAYGAFTVIVGVVYAIAGMGTFDAAAHALTTVSTGGFSTHADGFAHFTSPALHWAAIAAMVVAGSSFAMLVRAARGKPLAILRSSELRAYLAIVAAMCAAALLWIDGSDVRSTVFSTVSLVTTTGYTMANYTVWPVAVQLMLIFAMGLGGMSASTTGGFKVFRLLAVLSYSRRRLFRQLHPHAVNVIRFGSEIVSETAIARVVGFFGLFMAIGGVATFLVAALGADIVTSISSVASAIGNVGPALGTAGPPRGVAVLSAPARWVLGVVMLIGRLEVFPVILGVIPLVRTVADRLPRPVTRAFLRWFRG